MALFLGVHDSGLPTTDDNVKSSWANYKAACEKRGCKGLRVHYNIGQGKAFCVTDASSADDVRAAHDEIKLPLKDLVEVQILQ